MQRTVRRRTASENLRLFRRFLPYFKPRLPVLLLDLFCASLTTVCDLVLPLIVRYITNMGATNLAGLSIATIRAMAGVDFPVIRINPNTPAAIGKGLVLCCHDGVTGEQLARFTSAMAGAGLLASIEEKQMDAGSAVAGCGPAFAAMLIEALADGGVACGLPRADAQKFAAQMMLGTAALALETGAHPGALKDAVCSPGGSTIQGVRALEAGGFRSAAMEAVIAAFEKTRELGRK